ncbi:MAG: hypothetical protein HC788_09305 [Sphingopyxis sp.]|nr:hypothetical protein [Sphingopyxis sp.]
MEIAGDIRRNRTKNDPASHGRHPTEIQVIFSGPTTPRLSRKLENHPCKAESLERLTRAERLPYSPQHAPRQRSANWHKHGVAEDTIEIIFFGWVFQYFVDPIFSRHCQLDNLQFILRKSA